MSEDLLPYFLEEGRELTERASKALFDLERGVDSAEAVERALRAIHTLKGSTGLFDMAELGALLHAAESALECARNSDAALSVERMSVLNACVDETERWIEALDADGAVPAGRRRAAAALEASLRASRPSTTPEQTSSEEQPDGAAEPTPIVASLATRTVRVEAASLDVASDLLDQLIIAKNSLAHETRAALGDRAELRGVAAAQLTLDRSVAALHGALGHIRVAPLGRLFGPLPRQVREMADALGKQAELVISGGEVAVDKAIMDGLYEPLIHILRNAVDHGLESPAVREAAGKPARGVIRLAAASRGDAAVIEVGDDGAGLDLPRIRAAAVGRGLISAETAETLGDRETADLIFTPGFSTARKVTELSGRGVGLDAVRAAITRIGGRVEVENRPGHGAVVRITAPLRTLLARVVVLCVGQERYGVSLEAIREIVRIPRSEVTAVRAGEAGVVRGEPIPLLHLGELLGGERSRVDPLVVAVIDYANGRIGIAFDRVAESLQAPIQAASPLLSGFTCLSGSILQGDGKVLLLLDLEALTK